MKKLILFSIIILFFISLIGAETYQVDKAIDFPISCLNIDCGNDQNITVLYPNSTIFIDNQQTTSGNGYVYYTLTPDEQGTYQVFTIDNNSAEFYETTFDVTYTGEDIDEAEAIINAGLLIVLCFLLVISIYGIIVLPSENFTDDTGQPIKICYLKYLRGALFGVAVGMLWGILFVASNIAFAYLEGRMMGMLFHSFYIISGYIAVVVIVILGIKLILDVVQDNFLRKDIARNLYG